MKRLSVRLPDATIARLEAMLAELPVPAIGPAPTIADVLRVVVERGLDAMAEPVEESPPSPPLHRMADLSRPTLDGDEPLLKVKS